MHKCMFWSSISGACDGLPLLSRRQFNEAPHSPRVRLQDETNERGERQTARQPPVCRQQTEGGRDRRADMPRSGRRSARFRFGWQDSFLFSGSAGFLAESGYLFWANEKKTKNTVSSIISRTFYFYPENRVFRLTSKNHLVKY